MKAFSIVVLASGFSKRMGENKLFLHWQGEPLLNRTLRLALSLSAEKVILVLRPEDALRAKIPREVQVLWNREAEKGQSVSVRKGAAAAKGEGILFLPVDQPLFDRKSARNILQKGEAGKIVIPTVGKIPGSPVLFGRAFLGELLGLKGDEGGRRVYQKHPESCIFVEMKNHLALFDVDTPEDVRVLKKRQSLLQ